MTDETPENRIKRLKMRSWRRGTKEMDMLLGPYSDIHLAKLEKHLVNSYESLLNENDNDLYAWFSEREPRPVEHIEMIERILKSREGLV